MEDCIFCKIVNREIPSEIVYEDELVIAFKDIHPVTPIHILVIPKKHLESLLELEEEDRDLIGQIFMDINKIAKEQGIDKSRI